MQSFWCLDPLAADFASWSVYNYVLGNPIRLIDPDGRAPEYPIYGEDGTLIGYVVESGQGPTQIAQDLNQNYSCELSCSADWTQIVYDNGEQFQNVFDGDGNIEDKYNGDYKSGNIAPGDVLVITGGKINTEKEERAVGELTNTSDSLKKEEDFAKKRKETWDAVRKVFDGEDFKDGGPGATISAGRQAAGWETKETNNRNARVGINNKIDSLNGVIKEKKSENE